MKKPSHFVFGLLFIVLIGTIAVYSKTVGLPGGIKSKASNLEKIGCFVSFGRRGGWRIGVPETVELQSLTRDMLAPFGTESSGTKKPTFIEFEHQLIPNEGCNLLRNLSGNFHVVVQKNALSLECVEQVSKQGRLHALMEKDQDGNLTVLYD